MTAFPYHRICVIGTTGSGKSTMAGKLARQLHIPHIELDAFHWEPGWQEADRQQTRLRVSEIAQADAWVVDGNYGFLRDILWSRAEAVVWLDFSLGLIFWRLWWRTWKRVLSKEMLWGTNRERLGEQFFSKDSLFLWAIKTHRKHKMDYANLPSLPEYHHIKVYRLGNPRAAKHFLGSIDD
jgi:adenylate kinase family enzyme